MAPLPNKPSRSERFASFGRGSRTLALLMLAALALSSCTLGPDFTKPAAPETDRYNVNGDPTAAVGAGTGTQWIEAGKAPDAQWWRFYQSPELDSAVDAAVTGNLTLQIAEARLRQSKDALQAGKGVFYPQLSASLNQTRQNYNPAIVGAPSGAGVFNLTTLSANVSYALDVFGANRRAVESLGAQVDAQRANVRAAYLILTGNITNTIMAMGAYSDLIDEIQALITLEREQLAIDEKRYRAGLVNFSAVLATRNTLATLEASLQPLQQQLTQAEHLLATLEGKETGAWSAPTVHLSSLAIPQSVPLSLPSQLVNQRPDILLAEANLHSAGATVGVATAALLPSFNITGNMGDISTSMSNLFGGSGGIWGFGGSILAPVFNGGTLTAQRQAAIDAFEASGLTYRQTVIIAIAQVADCVKAIEHDALAVGAQTQAQAAAGQALMLAQANFSGGTANYLTVLTAQISLAQANVNLIQARAQYFQDTTALIVALGGGWWNREL